MANNVQIELSVPDALSDITLGQYQKYLKILDQNKDDDNAAEFINMKTIEIFCNIEFKDVLNIPLSEAEKVLTIINKAFEEKPDIIRHFKLLNVDMGFIPNLERISLGEYIDIENGITDWQTMHKAMAVLYRPVNFKSKEKYTIAPYEPSDEVSELMKEMPLDVAMSSMVFFYALGMELLKAIPTFIQENLTEEQTYLLKQTLAQSGVGINQFTHLLKGMSLDSIRLPKVHSSNASPT
jgi:hypothetical protein|tara:strand:+ start:890 stop:1603 length:714 start_codon:yes stop_codon:yes gene_type:complete